MEEIYSKIDNYLSSHRNTPIIVDLPNSILLDELITHYRVTTNTFVSASFYCKDNRLPQIDFMQYDLKNRDGNIFLIGLSSFLKLLGEDELRKELRTLLDMTILGKVVVLTLQCREYLNFDDLRLFSSSRIMICEGESLPLPTVVFINDSIDYQVDFASEGIIQFPKLYEYSCSTIVYIKTRLSKFDFPLSLISIDEISSSYCAIQHAFSDFVDFDEDCGSEGNWHYLLNCLNQYQDWNLYLNKEFGGQDSLLLNISQFPTFDKNKQWAFFIALRKHGAKGNAYLTTVLSNVTLLDQFYCSIFDAILQFDYKNSNFPALYEQRKVITKCIISAISPSYITNYIKKISIKKENKLRYLTDNSIIEREQIVETISYYHDAFSKDELLSILRIVYPGLYFYLQTYQTNIPLIDGYFNYYNYCKLTNCISTDFRKIVDRQSSEREYNKYLQPRSAIIDKIDKNKSILYFVDAFGVEYLGYLQSKCFEYGLTISVAVCRCNLPSLTSYNSEFVESFKSAGCKCVDIKELDSIKHSGQKNYNYENTKSPIHIVEELRLIENWISKIENELSSGTIEKVILASDHGASRLAVINETENNIVVSEKGQHSGRCCPKADSSEKPQYATEENGFWCLANYDRFKGGRKANVEVHGGASLEEVAVPVVTITRNNEIIDCFICDESRKISISFKKKAQLLIFVAKDSEKIYLIIDGHQYKAEKTDNKYYYSVLLPDIKKTGFYSGDIIIDGNIIKRDLTFEVQKEGASERKFF